MKVDNKYSLTNYITVFHRSTIVSPGKIIWYVIRNTRTMLKKKNTGTLFSNRIYLNEDQFASLQAVLNNGSKFSRIIEFGGTQKETTYLEQYSKADLDSDQQ